MNKMDLIKRIAGNADINLANARRAFSAIETTITDDLKRHENGVLIGLGLFKVSLSPARQEHNPHTGQPMQIPAQYLGFYAR